MKWLGCSLLVILLVRPGFAQEPAKIPSQTGIPVQTVDASAPMVLEAAGDENQGGFLRGDKGFRNFIGFISNSTVAFDPRSLTQLYPIYGHVHMDAIRPLGGGGDVNVAGPGLNLALTERLNIGLTNGGYVWTDFRKTREGWLNLGGYVQYTVIRDVPNQFLATAGLAWTAPSGSREIFQGLPPASLAPYATVGKEFCDFHILATAGYKFPAGSGTATTELFYGNLHLDRRCFGWLYPLVEFNWGVLNTNIDINRPVLRDLFGLDSFTATGNIITVATGFNAVIVQDKLEIGAVYQTPIASQNDIHLNAVLVKVVFRY